MFEPVRGNEPVESQPHFLHVIKDAKPQARRALLQSAEEELIHAIVECAISMLNGNHKLIKDENCKVNKYKNSLRALRDPKISFKSKGKVLIKKEVL